MFNDTINLGALVNPKELYLTPGLWDKQSVAFLWSFLFETPFALMRDWLGRLSLLRHVCFRLLV